MGIFVWCWCFYSTQLILFFKFKDLFKRVIYRNMQSVTVIFIFKEFIEDVGIRRFTSANNGAGGNQDKNPPAFAVTNR